MEEGHEDADLEHVHEFLVECLVHCLEVVDILVVQNL